MAIRGSLRVEGIRDAVIRVDDVGDRARRPERALRHANTLQDLKESERRRFARRQGWKKLTPAWVAEKRRRGLSTRILVATGKLESSLTQARNGVRMTVFNGELRWGITRGRSTLYYAQALARGRPSMPARRMVVIDKPAREAIANRLEEFIAYGFIRR